MALSKLGKYIIQSDARNSDGVYSEDVVVGLSTQKELIRTKANLEGVSLSSYKLMPPNSFAYVPDTSRRGDKVSLAYNQTDETFLVSSISIVFSVKSKDELLSDYLFMYFNRPEFDRYARFHSWGSARETFTWEEMCDITIKLPPLSVQQKYVDIYNALLRNQQSYERGLDDLKLVCDGYIENLRRNMECEEIGKYIYERNDRNVNQELDKVVGLSTTKQFREAQSRVDRGNLSGYKIMNPFDFVFVPTTDTWRVLAITFNNFNEKIVVSPIYEVFSVNMEKILPEYLMLWFKRTEFDRYARFHSWGSARENFSFQDMCEVKIPIPPIEIQQSIANIYNVYTQRKQINERLKGQIKAICPILIQGSIKES